MSDVNEPRYETSALPYRIAVLCYLWDTSPSDDDNLLMLHRAKPPNDDMYSPIGGKVEISVGESPHQCAIREIEEEAGLSFPPEQVRLMGVVAETGYQDEMHWLLFLFEVRRSVSPKEIDRVEFEEGRLEWIPSKKLEEFNIPRTDREIIWPLVKSHRDGGFFMVDVDCRDGRMDATMVEDRPTK